MVSKYFLLFKTAPSEFRAWANLSSEAKKNIIPIIELTRGKKIPKSDRDESDPDSRIEESKWRDTPGIYGFEKNVSSVEAAFTDTEYVILDLTREQELSCYEIDEIAKSANGYANWISFLSSQKEKFKKIIPTLLINPSADEDTEAYKANIVAQFKALMSNFDGACYRASVLLDTEFIYDLIVLKDEIKESMANGKRFIIELDHEFINPKSGFLHAVGTTGIIKKISEILPQAEIVILATSFPRSVADIGDPDSDSFPVEEISLYDEIKRNVARTTILHYGDYGSINPVRNDQVARGWRPRIDFTTSNGRILYYREKKIKDYGIHYASVAKNLKNDPSFEDIPNSWGVKQIKLAALGTPPGKAPSFWISVRMEIFIRQQLRRLGLV